MTIPIVFAFDKNYFLAAAVTISSLLDNSTEGEHYQIICLYSGLKKDELDWLMKLKDKYGKASFRLVDMKNTFTDAPVLLEHLNYTVYYRLMIPDLFPNYDKIVYSDVDIIFRRGMAGLWQESIGDNYVAGVLDRFVTEDTEFMKKRGFNGRLYINAGFLLYNNKKLIADNVPRNWLDEIGKPLNYYMDQDIINRVCEGHIKRLPLYYNCFSIDPKWKFLSKFPEAEIDEAFKRGNVHYTSKDKPWNNKKRFYRSNELIWWKYYWKLPFGSHKQVLRHFNIFVCRLLNTLVCVTEEKIKRRFSK
ncbi:glycosyltransferase family 8 protein [Parabacteroides bouchesdurhonensis]|uniref:glycosyltransferase family 8 protein n=1 Tax=Parabacteroides bouchesdurhonensis TaxID=1936995 RepID=UPI000E4C0E96|nr:glycosyltransferase family 8 protein [Parabacteroides bouchesdurhonensis]RHJ94926.1 glycosyltransferase family 8 protein [Bacteroides sp. AM07-16]